MSVKNKRLYDMYGYERVFLICWKKSKNKIKENQNEEKESTNT